MYFLAFPSGEALTPEQKKASRFNREGQISTLRDGPIPNFGTDIDAYSLLLGVLELTHNHGTESDPSFSGYASGNTDPGKGFGHIAITVPDIQLACARFEQLGVPFKKRLTDGKMRDIAFILDPDG